MIFATSATPQTKIFIAFLNRNMFAKYWSKFAGGARLEIRHACHFTDRDADCVAEIFELNAIEEHRDDMLLAAACHLTHFDNPLIAELLIIHCLSKGYTVNEIVYDSIVGESFYGGSECLEEDFLPFVTMCDKKRLYDKLDSNLKPLGLAKRVVKI